MADGPINPDREQQRRDNVVSRRQSGLEPRPEDVEKGEPAKAGEREVEKRDDEESDDSKGNSR